MLESKIELMSRIEEGLSEVLTVSNLNQVMSIIANELGNCNVEMRNGNEVEMDMLNAYLDAKSIEGRSKKTIERYRYIINKMMNTVKVPTRRITVFHLRSYLMSEKQRGVSDNTLAGYRDIFCAYFNWLQRESLIDTNPTTNLGSIKCAKQVNAPFSDVEIERLKASCGCSRDKAIICFLLTTGCRISEAVGLNRDDIDIKNMQCKVLGKGNKERMVYFDNITTMYLKKYLSSRNDLSPALFVGKGTNRMTPGGVRKMLNQVAEIAKVDHVHPHRFRRTLATNLINRGMSIQEVARILGHDKLDTTMRYVYINDRDVQMAYRKYS